MLMRRPFLKTALATAAFASLKSAPAEASMGGKYRDTMGLQLYTLRNQMAAKPSATLRAVQEAGYAQVELMDVNDADVMVPLAKEHGLSVSSGFMNWEIIGNSSPKDKATVQATIDKAAKNGLKYLVFGYIGKGHRETISQFQGIADRSNAAGEKCKAAGIQLCYHHHSFEFLPLEGKTTGFEVLVERFSPELVQFEIDIFWAAIGGLDPVETLNRLKGRVAQVHLKDLLKGTDIIFDEGKVPKEAFKEVGAGALDMAKVIASAEATGVAQCHVEQDQSPDPLASVGQSIHFLKS